MRQHAKVAEMSNKLFIMTQIMALILVISLYSTRCGFKSSFRRVHEAFNIACGHGGNLGRC